MENLEHTIDRLPPWKGKQDIQIEHIAGLTNQNYGITVDGERFVLRISGENTQRLGIDRSHELAVLQAAAAAGIGPEVVAFLLPQGHLVTRWVDGRHWRLRKQRYSLVGEVCPYYDAKLFPPRDVCPECGGDSKNRYNFNARGEEYSYTTVYKPLPSTRNIPRRQ